MATYSDADLKRIKEQYSNFLEDVKLIHQTEDEGLRNALGYLIVDKYKSLRVTRADIDRELRSLTVSKDVKKLYSVKDILQDSETASYLVDRILTKSGLFILAAAPKTYKSLLAYHLAYSVIRGTKFLGRFQTTKGKVLMIQVEESKDIIRTRLKNTGFDRSDDNFRILRNFSINDIDYLRKVIQDFKPDLVIIDTLRAVTADTELSENTAEFARPLYRLQSLAAESDICFLVLHHKVKNNINNGVNAVSGSSAIVGATDGVFLLDTYGDKLLLSSIPRNMPSTRIALSYGGRIENGQYRFVFDYLGDCDLVGGELVIQEDYALQIEEALVGNPMDFHQFNRQFPKWEHQRTLERLISFGLVVVDKETVYWYRDYGEFLVSSFQFEEFSVSSFQFLENKNEEFSVSSSQFLDTDNSKLKTKNSELKTTHIHPWAKDFDAVEQGLPISTAPETLYVVDRKVIDALEAEKRKHKAQRIPFNAKEFLVSSFQFLDDKDSELKTKNYQLKTKNEELSVSSFQFSDTKNSKLKTQNYQLKTTLSEAMFTLDMAVLHDLLSQYGLSKVREAISEMPKQSQAVCEWWIERYWVCMYKDIRKRLKIKLELDQELRLYNVTEEDKIKIRAMLKTISISNQLCDYHKVCPPKDVYPGLANLSLKAILPFDSLHPDITLAFWETAKKVWQLDDEKIKKMYNIQVDTDKREKDWMKERFLSTLGG